MLNILFHPSATELSHEIALRSGEILRDLGFNTCYSHIYDREAFMPHGDIVIHICCQENKNGYIEITGYDPVSVDNMFAKLQHYLRYPSFKHKGNDYSIIIDIMPQDLDTATGKRATQVERLKNTIAQAIAYSIKNIQICPLCYAGPYKNLKLHISRVH